jgi:tetratricopeptide (TPR) repeat protein
LRPATFLSSHDAHHRHCQHPFLVSMTRIAAASAQPIEAGTRKWTWLKALVILLAGAYVFGPAIGGGWLWDDNQEVTENAVLRDPAGLVKIWTGAAGADYFPLKTTVQWFGWRMWGDSPAGYHALSIACHVLSAFLFWLLLVKLRRGPSATLGAFASGATVASPGRKPEAGVEWLGGLLFVVHPLVVESVAWAAELKNTLSLPLLLAAMIAYLDYDGLQVERLDPKALVTGRSRASALGSMRSTYFLSLGFFVLALLAKSSVAMFPLVILLYAWWQRGRIGRRDLMASLPFFAAALGLGLVTFWFQHHRAMQPAEIEVLAGGPLSRLAGAGLALAFYLGESLLPLRLSPIYPRWPIDPPALVQFAPWLGFALLTGWLWSQRAGRGRSVLFALGFFAINLLPVLGFVTFTYMKESWVADHFVYISLLGVIGLAVAALGRWRVPLAVPLVVAAALAWESRGYAAVFRNEDALWTYTIRQNPESLSAHYNLATYLGKRGESARAIGEFQAALRLRPAYVDAHNNLGNTLLQSGRLPEAIAQYEEALRLNPAYADARVGLGYALFQVHRIPEAIAQDEEVARLRPDSAIAHANLGNALAYAGRLAEAAAQYEDALRLNPNDARVRSNLNIVRQVLRQ